MLSTHMTKESFEADRADQRAQNTPAGRRTFLQAMAGGAAAGMAGLAGCMGDGGDGQDTTTTGGTTSGGDGKDKMADTLKFYSWGGSTQEALSKHLIKPFEEEHGVTVKQSSFSSQDKMLANVRSSPEGSYDVIMPSVSGSYSAAKQGLVEPIRTDNVGTWSNLLPTFQDFKVMGQGSKKYVAPVYYGTVGMVYNSDEVSGSPPFSWEKTWDDQWKGKLTLEGFGFVRVFTTALKMGMDPNKIQGDDGTYESGIQKVYDEMAKQHELVKKYWTSGQEQTTLYSNNSAVIGDGWSGRILALQEDGYDNLKYTIPKEGAYGWGDAFAIAKGSKHRYTAEKFIEYAYRPEVMEKLSPELGYPPATKATTSEIKELPDFDPSGGERLVFQDQKFKSEHQQDWSQTFKKIKLGQY